MTSNSSKQFQQLSKFCTLLNFSNHLDMETWTAAANSSQNNTEINLNRSKVLLVLQLLFHFTIIVIGSNWKCFNLLGHSRPGKREDN